MIKEFGGAMPLVCSQTLNGCDVFLLLNLNKHTLVKSQSSPVKGETSKAPSVASTSGSVQPSTTGVSYLDSIESAAVKQLIQKFPITEMAARGINESEWTDSLFVVKQDGNTNKITVPKNIETFSESLMMMSLLKIFEIKKWQPVLSTKELPKAVLETKEGAFFAGFVSGALREETGELNDGTSKYAKGVKAFQTYSVEKAYGKAKHLRTGGMAKVTERLSVMKGFSQAYWGLRGSIVTLFKSLPPAKVTNLETYVLSKSELLKNIKTRLHYENGGCYRPEELAFMATKYQVARNALTGFIASLDHPTEDLAKRFDQLYAPVKTLVDAADNEIKANLASRARILFPPEKKKATIAWAKKPLVEKLLDLSEDKKKTFYPETLPGIMVAPELRSEYEDLESFVSARYPQTANNESIKEVVFSWFSNFEEE
jgi:hypothetical protein